MRHVVSVLEEVVLMGCTSPGGGFLLPPLPRCHVAFCNAAFNPQSLSLYAVFLCIIQWTNSTAFK